MEEQLIDTVLTLPPAEAEDGGAPMMVAVEATRLLREVRGIGRYVRALLPRLVALRPGLSLVLFVKNQRDVEALEPVFAAMPSLRDHVELRPVREMTKSRADVFWYPWNTASPTPARGPVVATMHDIVPIAHPDPRLRGWQKNLRWRRRYAATARRATLIIADSQFTADEIHRMLDVPRDRMRVALLAADDFMVPPADGDVEALARLGVRTPFVLAVGAADRRKNLALLERAMPRVVAANPGTTLVLAGPRRDAQSPLADASWRQTLGFVSDEELAALYRAAGVLVMPSTYEGFGLPVLEAMRLGTPVICAHGSSLPEVAGDAALWVDGEDDADLAAKIGQVLSDPRVSSSMRSASLKQSSRFSWDETARQTIAAFEEAVEMVAPLSS
jgi:glycosyltransferase involved in cell wall biosynthesis